jgi:hypothetical protein
MKHQYLDNKLFLESLINYKRLVNEYEEAGKPLPQIPEYIGKCFLDISKNISRRPEFINYSFIEEMISDAYENCLQYWYTFDANQSTNPFGYFSRTVYNAFVRRIQKEKKQQYIRYKEAFNSGIFDSGETLTDSSGNAIVGANNLADNMYEFIRNYEEKLQVKNEAKKIKSAKKPIRKKKVKK